MQKYFDLRSKQFDQGIKDQDLTDGPMQIPLGLESKYNEMLPPFTE